MSENKPLRLYTWKEVEPDDTWKIMVGDTRVAVCPRKSGWKITDVRYRREEQTDEVDELVVTIRKKGEE